MSALAEQGNAKGVQLIPGHGALVDNAALSRYRGLLDDLERAATSGFTAGRTAKDTAAAYTVPTALGEWMAGRPSIERVMNAWYVVLEAERGRRP